MIIVNVSLPSSETIKAFFEAYKKRSERSFAIFGWSVRNRAMWAENRKIWLAREFRTP